MTFDKLVTLIEATKVKLPKYTPRQAYELAKNLGKRVPALEPIILRQPIFAYEYARDVIKGRWPEAEPVIMKDIIKESYLVREYAENVIKGR